MHFCHKCNHFPVAALTNYHKLGSLEHTHVLLHSFGVQEPKWDSVGWTQGMGRAMFIPGGMRKEAHSISWSFPGSIGSCVA